MNAQPTYLDRLHLLNRRFTWRQVRRLIFLRWLYETGRLSEEVEVRMKQSAAK